MINIKFIHYDAPNADKSFIQAIKEADSSKKPLYIFDEVHNFIRNTYNNLTENKGKRAQIIYDYILISVNFFMC
jgi:superfamily II DNA or RNA helicase